MKSSLIIFLALCTVLQFSACSRLISEKQAEEDDGNIREVNEEQAFHPSAIAQAKRIKINESYSTECINGFVYELRFLSGNKLERIISEYQNNDCTYPVDNTLVESYRYTLGDLYGDQAKAVAIDLIIEKAMLHFSLDQTDTICGGNNWLADEAHDILRLDCSSGENYLHSYYGYIMKVGSKVFSILHIQEDFIEAPVLVAPDFYESNPVNRPTEVFPNLRYLLVR